MLSLPDIEVIFQRRGDAQYAGEPVTQLEHALQTATLAETSGADDELVSACLLHDLGHLLHDVLHDVRHEALKDAPHGSALTPTLHGIDDTHQYAAMPFLRGLFGPRVLDSIKLHVDAKRYLCAVRDGYHAALSADSQRSLVLQGGVFSDAQAARFMAQPAAEDAVQLRLWDDQAKVAGATTPQLAHFLARAARCALA